MDLLGEDNYPLSNSQILHLKRLENVLNYTINEDADCLRCLYEYKDLKPSILASFGLPVEIHHNCYFM
jgi:hypothetical protein